jgi:hypothetical protein
MRRLLLAALVAFATPAFADDWVAYSDRDDVASYSRSIPGSKVLAMKGVSTLDVPIGRLIGVYLDAARAPKWVDLMISLEEHKLPGGHDAIERQLYDMPWPVYDREFVFKRTVAIDPATKTVTISYKSIQDARHPVTDDYVRATDYGSYWKFTALPGGKTRVEAVAMVDPEGSLPAWLFNSVQRSWPRESIHGIKAEASKPDVVPFPDVAGW